MGVMKRLWESQRDADAHTEEELRDLEPQELEEEWSRECKRVNAEIEEYMKSLPPYEANQEDLPF
jgi:hypothetical protein